MSFQKFENLQYLCDLDQGSDAAVVLFHGYGASADDLAPLSKVFLRGSAVDWYFPQGVLEVPIGMGFTGRAWFQLRMSDLENLSDLEKREIPREAEKLLGEVNRFLNHLGSRYSKVIIGGFSQGAILTSHCFYRLDFKPAGMILWSGVLMAPSTFPANAPDSTLSFLQTHGLQDTVLSVSGAQSLYQKLKSLGLQGSWLEFPGGHEIPVSVIQATENFLKKNVGLQG